MISLNAWHDQNANDSTTRLMLAPNATTTLTSVSNPKKEATLLIGPEGGFSNAEEERAASTGIQLVSLGPRILRTETAAIAAISVVQTLWGDFS